MLPFEIFITVTVCMLTAFWALSATFQPGRSRIRRRLAGEFLSGETSVSNPLYKSVDKLETDSVEELNLSTQAEIGNAQSLLQAQRQTFEIILRQSGIPATVQQVVMVDIACAAVFSLIGWSISGWIGVILGLVIGITGPFVIVTVMRTRRLNIYTSQLSNAFELMARVLRSGQTVSEVLRSATVASDEPLAGEFGRCQHQIEHGIRPEMAYRELSERAGILELRVFFMAMSIQRQTGGNLSETLERLASLVRIRIRFRQKIRALTAEGHMQSWTLVVLPFLTYGAMFFLNRKYAEQLLEHGNLLMAMVGCMVFGILWIRKIMNFEG